MKDNPKAALAALTSPAKLTLGKVALLCRLDSPVLAGKIDDMPKCLTATLASHSLTAFAMG